MGEKQPKFRRMLSKYLDPKNDIAFKKIFGTEKNKDILIHFLNDMIQFKDHGKIIDVRFLKTIQDPETAFHKSSIVDILCTDQNGDIYIVEMQVANEKGFEKRAQYYASKAYISQAHAGNEYHNLKEVIFLAIADFVMFPNKKSYKSDHVILDRDTYDHDLKDFSFTFLELPKFNKEIDQLSNMSDKWAYFFKHAEETSEIEFQKLTASDQIIERAFDELNRFSWSDEELLTYDQTEKYIGCYRASMAFKYDEGMAKGREEGRAEGRIEEKVEVAKALLEIGISLEKIQEVTKLPVNFLEKLVAEQVTALN